MRQIALVIMILFSSTVFSQDDLKKAQQLANSGKYTEAIELYTAVLTSQSNNLEALLGRGYTYSWKHDFQNASADFSNVLKIQPGNMEAQKGLAYAALWSGDNKKAIKAFNELIAKKQDSKEFYIALGQAQMNDGLLKEARQSFLKAEQLAPNDAEPKQLIFTPAAWSLP